jgi:DNA invertase Pin-like site-specific DNA recombinase
MARASKRKTVDPSKVVAYVRVSTAEQATSGLGLEAQLAAIRAHAAANGLDIVQIFSDEGLSAKTLDRPQLTAALHAVTSGEAAGIVVTKVDRLSRSLADLLDLVDSATRDGWRLICMDLGLDSGTAGGRFTLSLLGAVSELERNLISERTRSALAAKKSRGDRLGRPVVLPAQVRARIASEREHGRTMAEIAEGLRGDGVPTPRGGTWSRAAISNVLASIRLDREAHAITNVSTTNEQRNPE